MPRTLVFNNWKSDGYGVVDCRIVRRLCVNNVKNSKREACDVGDRRIGVKIGVIGSKSRAVFTLKSLQ